jgi:hypothetical protein
MKTTLKIGGSCGLGALFGTLLALLLSPWLWWVGAIVGGLVAYVACDLTQIIQEISVVWKELSVGVSRFPWSRVRLIAEFILYSVITASTLLLLPVTFLSFVLSKFFGGPQEVSGKAGDIPTFWVIILLSFIFSSLASGFFMEKKGPIGGDIKKARVFVLYFNPISAPFTVLYWIILGILWCVDCAPIVCRIVLTFCWKFFWKLFILVHSEIRAICFVDAFLGATIGAFYGHHEHVFALAAIVGATSGALLGIINYRLVSISWLKLKPA